MTLAKPHEDALRSQVRAGGRIYHTQDIADLLSAYDAEHATVARVWKALGIETYEQAGGKEISEIVSALRSDLAKMTERAGAAETFNRVAQGTIDKQQAQIRLHQDELTAANARVAELERQVGQAREWVAEWSAGRKPNETPATLLLLLDAIQPRSEEPR